MRFYQKQKMYLIQCEMMIKIYKFEFYDNKYIKNDN